MGVKGLELPLSCMKVLLPRIKANGHRLTTDPRGSSANLPQLEGYRTAANGDGPQASQFVQIFAIETYTFHRERERGEGEMCIHMMYVCICVCVYLSLSLSLSPSPRVCVRVVWVCMHALERWKQLELQNMGCCGKTLPQAVWPRCICSCLLCSSSCSTESTWKAAVACSAEPRDFCCRAFFFLSVGRSDKSSSQTKVICSCK